MPTKTRKSPLKGSPRRKSPRKRASKTASEDTRDRWNELAYKSVLPFGVHENGVLAPIEVNRTDDVYDYIWSDERVAVAKAALASGYTLSVPVPANFVAQATSAICRSLRCQVCAGYDSRNAQLVLWGPRNEDDEVDLVVAV